MVSCISPKCIIIVLTGSRYAYCCALSALVIAAGTILQYFGINPVLLNIVYFVSLVVIFVINCCGVLVSLLSLQEIFLVDVSLVVRLNRVLWRNRKTCHNWRPIHLDDVYQWRRFVMITYSLSDWLILSRSQPGLSSFWLDPWVHDSSLLTYMLTLFKPS